MTILIHSCIAKKIAVRHADLILQHQITQKIPIDYKQKILLSKDLKNLLNQYQNKTKDSLYLINNFELNEKKIEELHKTLLPYYLEIIKDFAKIISRYLADLDGEQQNKLFLQFQKDDKIFLVKKKEERMDNFIERFEYFFGTILPGQKILLHKYGPYLEEKHILTIGQRKIIYNRFQEIYAKSILKDTKSLLFAEAMMTYYETILKSSQLIQILKELIPTLSPKQLTFFRHRVEDIKEMINIYLQTKY